MDQIIAVCLYGYFLIIHKYSFIHNVWLGICTHIHLLGAVTTNLLSIK